MPDRLMQRFQIENGKDRVDCDMELFLDRPVETRRAFLLPFFQYRAPLIGGPQVW